MGIKEIFTGNKVPTVEELQKQNKVMEIGKPEQQEQEEDNAPSMTEIGNAIVNSREDILTTAETLYKNQVVIYQELKKQHEAITELIDYLKEVEDGKNSKKR